MYSRAQRALSTKERSQLCAAVPEPESKWQWFLDWYLRDIMTMVFIGIFSVWIWSWKTAVIALIAYFFIEKILIGSLKASLERFRFLRTERVNRDRLLKIFAETESVTVEKVVSDRVVAVYGDDCELYVFDVGNNQLYWSSVTAPKSKWPNSSFEVVQIPGFDDVLPPTCHGTKLKPLAEVDIREIGVIAIPEQNPSEGSLDALLSDARTNGD